MSDADMYNHDDPFDENDTPGVHVSLPYGETLAIYGPRSIPAIITVSNRIERSPQRDARMLATFLSCSLDQETFNCFLDCLYKDSILPYLQDTALKEALKATVKRKPKPKIADDN